MRRATRHLPAGAWASRERCATVTLAYDERQRRRLRMKDDRGEPFLLDLPAVTRLEDGGGLALVDGGFIQICAAREEVLDIECHDSADLARVAWHIGNRHVPLQVLQNGRLRILADKVIKHMLCGLGAKLMPRCDKFLPESGAYRRGDAQVAAEQSG